MKFTDGFWRSRENMRIAHAAEVYDCELSRDSITVYAPYQHVANRGMTLQGPLLSVTFSSPMPDVICVKAEHYRGVVDKGPHFAINRQECASICTFEDSNSIILKSGSASVRINKGDWNVDFLCGDKVITGSGWRCLAYILDENNNPYMREQLALDVGECVYGLGERFTAFVKNGQEVDIWNADGGTCSELSYKNIPFYITSKGYGVFVNHTGKVSFEVASENVSRVQFSVPGESLEYFVIAGQTPKEVLKKYTSLTGRPALPPAWSFGLWLSTSFVTQYDEGTVTSFIDGMAERDIPLSVFHFDCFWMREYHWTDLVWDRRMFSDPEGMLRRLKERGLRICVWINPYIAQRSALFAEGMEKGYLIRRPNGDVYQVDTWQPGMGFVDFTNPEACKWFAEHLRRLLDMGVDCFKTDFGERIPEDCVYWDGSDPVRMHNYYTHLYNQTVFNVLKERFGEGKAIVFARSATAGGQKFPVHWGGDNTAKYVSMAESLRGGLSLCLSGFGFWSHDISGFEHTATPDLYKRWAAFGLLSTHSRLHGNMSYRVPWLFDEEAVDVLRHFTKLKCRLMPYLFSMACEAASRGIPMMRAMILEYPEDPGCLYLDRQYMLGDSLLVAPVFSEDGTVSYYLPEGNWTHLLTGAEAAGGGWRNEKHGYLSLPLMVRENSIIAMGKYDDTTDYDFADGVEFHVFGLKDGARTEAKVYDTAGDQKLRMEAIRQGGTIRFNLTGESADWYIVLRGIGSVSAALGGTCEYEGQGVRITPKPGTGQIDVTL
jgi:alpha-D-xyloside xylohydrolase